MSVIKRKDLPDGWAWKTMGEISDIIGGGTPRTNVPEYYNDGNIPWITPADLSGYNNKYIGHGSRFITEAGLKNSSARLLPVGTVLFTTRAPIGYVAIASNPISTNQGFKSFVLREGILPDYVYWYLKGNKDLAESYASGTTFLELAGAKAKQIPIPIAPPNEQKLIVSEIEKQFSRLDEAVVNLKRVKANLKRYKAAVLKAAVEGKLTEEWRKKKPDVEAASELLKRILAEKRRKWEADHPGNKYKEPASPNTSNLPALPKGWVWATIEQLATKVQYGSSAKTNEHSSGVPVLRMGNIFEGQLKLDDLKYLPKNHPEFPDLLLEKGDLLFNRTNSPELVGKTTVYMGKPKPCSFASYLIRVKMADGIRSNFVSFYINSVYGRKWIKTVVSQQVGQANVNGTKLQALSIPLPPNTEQQKIIEEVESRLSVAEGIETAIDANLQRAERLRQSILKKAFSGKLIYHT